MTYLLKVSRTLFQMLLPTLLRRSGLTFVIWLLTKFLFMWATVQSMWKIHMETIFGTGQQFKEILMTISCKSLQNLLIFERKSVPGTVISKIHR